MLPGVRPVILRNTRQKYAWSWKPEREAISATLSAELFRSSIAYPILNLFRYSQRGIPICLWKILLR